MYKDDVIEFLEKIDKHISKNHREILGEEKFELKVIGKCSLLLSGLEDSVGTVDLDSLPIHEHLDEQVNQVIKDSLIAEYGRAKQKINGYYLEFVSPAIVFLPSHPKWHPISGDWSSLSVVYMDSNDVVASKCFSAFSSPPRGKDRQDVVSALDQGIANLKTILPLVDQIFKTYEYDSRKNRFPSVYQFVSEKLIPNYGGGELKYELLNDLE